jgi:phage tail sheath protein FI
MAHGLTFTNSNGGARSLATSSTSVIGIIATASAAAGAATNALNAAFPLNTPVLVTNIIDAIGNAGTGGTLLPALQAIADQVTPVLVVVRVAEGEDDTETSANVIGGNVGGIKTGLQALIAAKSVVNVRPRIIGAPGLDTASVTAQLAIAAKRLRGRTYARAIGETDAEVMAYRETFSAKELTLIWPNTSPAFIGDATARALGLRAQIDESTGWHKTISNVKMDGVTALTRNIAFDLLDSSTEAGVLNDADIVTIIREFGGFRFWGNTTCAGEDQSEYRFESAVRTLHALQDIVIDAFAPEFDKPMNTALVKDLLESCNTKFDELATSGWIMGAKVDLAPTGNTSAELAAGRPKFRLKFTPCAPFENPSVDFAITDEFYSDFASQIAA